MVLFPVIFSRTFCSEVAFSMIFSANLVDLIAELQQNDQEP